MNAHRLLCLGIIYIVIKLGRNRLGPYVYVLNVNKKCVYILFLLNKYF